jgi:anti-sigma factor RsiW
MSDDLLNILSNSNKDIDNQKLMDYLSDKLSAEEKHEVEKTLVDSELMNDAVEGL